MAVCSRCIVPDSFPGINFNNEICSFCQDYKNHEAIPRAAPEPLELVLGQTENNSRYDCLVPISGGKDSSYILYYVVKRLGLKPFAVFCDTGFTHPLAKKNVNTICRKLGVEWATVKSPHNYRRKAVIEAIRISRYLGRLFGVCKNCENNLRTAALNQARELGITTIIWGSTDYGDTIDTYHQRFADQPSFRHRFGNGMMLLGLKTMMSMLSRAFIRGSYHIVKFAYYLVRDNFDIKAPGGLKRLNPLYQVPFNANGAIRTVYFFNHVPYDPEMQLRVLKEELAWDSISGKDTRMDCRLRCLENFNKLSRTGLSSDGFIMANLVRADLMSRETALKKEAAIRESIVRDCRETLKLLGLSGYPLLAPRSAITPMGVKM